jgi:hypothetical protein
MITMVKPNPVITFIVSSNGDNYLTTAPGIFSPFITPTCQTLAHLILNHASPYRNTSATGR